MDSLAPLAYAAGGVAATLLCLAPSGDSSGSATAAAADVFEGPPDAPAGPTTLTYWNGRGLAESVRLMLAFTGEEYAERVPVCHPSIKHLAEPAQLADLRDEG